jgi:flagellar motor protein MotB
VSTLKGLVKPFTGCALAGTASTQEIANVLLALATLQTGNSYPQQQQQQQQQQQPHWQMQQQQQQQQQQEVPEPIPARVVQVLLAAFMQQLQDSSPQEVCNVLWAAAKLQYCVDPGDIQQLADHAMGQPSTTVPASSIHPAVQQQQQQQQQQRRQRRQLTQSEAANLLWSLASLQQLQKQQRQAGEVPLPVPLPQLQLLLSLVWGQASLQSVGEQELANSLWAAAGFEPCVLPEGLLSRSTFKVLAGRVGGMGLQVRREGAGTR